MVRIQGIGATTPSFPRSSVCFSSANAAPMAIGTICDTLKTELAELKPNNENTEPKQAIALAVEDIANEKARRYTNRALEAVYELFTPSSESPPNDKTVQHTAYFIYSVRGRRLDLYQALLEGLQRAQAYEPLQRVLSLLETPDKLSAPKPAGKPSANNTAQRSSKSSKSRAKTFDKTNEASIAEAIEVFQQRIPSLIHQGALNDRARENLGGAIQRIQSSDDRLRPAARKAMDAVLSLIRAHTANDAEQPPPTQLGPEAAAQCNRLADRHEALFEAFVTGLHELAAQNTDFPGIVAMDKSLTELHQQRRIRKAANVIRLWVPRLPQPEAGMRILKAAQKLNTAPSPNKPVHGATMYYINTLSQLLQSDDNLDTKTGALVRAIDKLPDPLQEAAIDVLQTVSGQPDSDSGISAAQKQAFSLAHQSFVLYHYFSDRTHPIGSIDAAYAMAKLPLEPMDRLDDHALDLVIRRQLGPQPPSFTDDDTPLDPLEEARQLRGMKRVNRLRELEQAEFENKPPEKDIPTEPDDAFTAASKLTGMAYHNQHRELQQKEFENKDDREESVNPLTYARTLTGTALKQFLNGLGYKARTAILRQLETDEFQRRDPGTEQDATTRVLELNRGDFAQHLTTLPFSQRSALLAELEQREHRVRSQDVTTT